jgi:hypothetical protein
VAVVSKGDPQLVEIEGRLGLHFPRDSEGRYAGHYPKTSEEAVGQVESLRRDGAQFLCLPSTASWWLDHYQGLAGWLEAHCRIAAEQAGTCILYDLLRPPGVSAEATVAASSQVRSLLDALLPEEAVLFVVGAAADDYSAPGRQVTPLGTSHAVGLRHLAAPEVDRPTFVLVARDDSAPPLDEAMEAFLARRTEPVARRENLCDVLRVKAASRNRSRIGASDRGEAGLRASRGSSLQGEWAQKLSGRLERLGLAEKTQAAALGRRSPSDKT